MIDWTTAMLQVYLMKTVHHRRPHHEHHCTRIACSDSKRFPQSIKFNFYLSCLKVLTSIFLPHDVKDETHGGYRLIRIERQVQGR
ncbi:hypothetical protein GUITHDRAFT_154022 [Guillardia theta CCMP2712]|uniref:Uncharacterized protein n=1 Tax=Guillardia theta (strain CCMP2712) TaxID=905079 RepID=L1IXN3_GUITC|nr:hypothetical protein GUITHDRAFT_154022 [Guillardia theta CCMP2712]EKX40837.1 hypothetical protein GUITHDRAFT_154022 [Guillardia theta CCMP2712]|mmetsp:Transcript_27788/g.90405  ORF Transcript_27788/g.90405 Transcript_27788/m.90405 type:complete len:85 (+) Transcript_27788:832-1086(+)|eukprot:XP_005827817.1 hypothetical protein GUITHDRAFT_154022 [Guillardia theta CCMP2712]